MNTQLLAGLVFVFALTIDGYSQAQQKIVVNGVNINELKEVRYVELLGIIDDDKLVIEVDYGQKKTTEPQVISGPDNKPHHFESMIGALNFMDLNGWEFVNAFEIKSNHGAVYHFILKRKD